MRQAPWEIGASISGHPLLNRRAASRRGFAPDEQGRGRVKLTGKPVRQFGDGQKTWKNRDFFHQSLMDSCGRTWHRQDFQETSEWKINLNLPGWSMLSGCMMNCSNEFIFAKLCFPLWRRRQSWWTLLKDCILRCLSDGNLLPAKFALGTTLPRNREKVDGSSDTFSHKRQLLTTIQPSVSTPPYSLASSAQYFSGTPLFLSSSILPSQEISSHQELSRIFAHKRLMLLISIDSPTYWCDCITNPNNEAPFTQITQIGQHVHCSTFREADFTTNSSMLARHELWSFPTSD